jgi:hypothetical protein
VFGASYRKVTIWQRDSQGKEHTDKHDYWSSNVTEFAHTFEDEYIKRNLLLPQGMDSKCSILIHSHEHDGMAANPTRVGWAFESMFQQRKIAYFVRNRILDINYIFNPDTNHIEFIDFEH